MSITKPISFIQIAVNADHIIGLTMDGDVYYRDKPPFSHTSTNNYSHVGGYQTKKDDDEKKEKKCWKKLYMYELVEPPKGGHEREAQPSTDPAPAAVVDEPARKVYKDVETVKKVQTALKEKQFYKDTYKIDGDLGNLTVNAIKAFQKSVELNETGEVDLELWRALGLLGSIDDNETVAVVAPIVSPTDLPVDSTETDGVENDYEAFYMS